MTAKHTPGPWTLVEHEHEPCELIGNGTIKIAEIYMTDFPTGKVDSLLIAAAPELLADLEGALDQFYMLTDNDTRDCIDAGTGPHYYHRGRATIAKAKGI